MRDMIGSYYAANNEIKSLKDFDESIMLQGKTIYEVIRVMDGRPLFYDMHIERLHKSAELAKVEINISDSLMRDMVKGLIAADALDDGNIKIAFNNGSLYMFQIKHRYPDTMDYLSGVSAVLFMGERKDPNIKLIDTEFRNRANEKIQSENAYEAILVDHNGYITEGSRSNIFMVKEGSLITSPGEAVLPGITRTIIMKAAARLNIQVREERIHYKDINTLDGIFISGTSPKVLPVSMVDGIKFKSAENSIIQMLMTEYDKIAEEDINNFKY